MIQDVGWIPTDFPAQGNTALMRARFSEAVAAFSLQGGDLVTASQAKLGSVTLLHPKGKKGLALAESILSGELPAAMAGTWVLVMDAQGGVHEHGVRPDGIQDLELTP